MTTKQPVFLCLAPLWNHRQDTIENSIQCFIDQKYPHKRLLLIDDRPPEARADRFLETDAVRRRMFEKYAISYITSNWRFGTLPNKYNFGLNAVDHWLNGDGVTHIAIWDDDDGFSPLHLQLAAEAYDHPAAMWTYPETVFTTFGGHLHTEPSSGRFWSSITFHKQCLWDEAVDTWRFPQTKACGHDQMFLEKLRSEYGDPARPEDIPTYVYRWGQENENHSSGASTGFTCERWWDATPYATATRWFEPQYDEFYKQTLKEMEAGFPASLGK